MSACPSFWGRPSQFRMTDEHKEPRTFTYMSAHKCCLGDGHDGNHECECGSLLGRLPSPDQEQQP